ncbi:hypothetical protein D5086_007489 [Populus alba]|uniref:Uncharacterized protein n=1 Tax=Populus alba TaxID=43335 RepID=A0ACC4CQ13_POPAL
MEIFEVVKDKLGFDFKRYSTLLLVCAIALPVSFMILIMYQNPSFDLTGGLAKAEKSGNVSIIIVESDSRNDSSQSTRMPDDKLLDGLLAPRFDESSCLSRYRSSLFRKTSPHKPSPYLLSKLRRYEDLHKRCGPHTKPYNKAFKRLKSSHGSSGGCNYLVWIPVNGLGNRMISLASTFLYALLTDRVLLVELGNDMSDLFCEPFPNSSWMLPKNFPGEVEFRSPDKRHARGYGNQLKNGIINESMESLPSYTFLNLDHSHYDLDRLSFYCNQNPTLLRKIEQGNTRNPSCVRDLSMEPCFHFPPTYDCRTKTKMNAGSLFPYVKYCKDLNWGVKLVGDGDHQELQL